MLVFLSLFDEHPKDSRVIVPLLVSLDKLLSHGCLNTLLEDKRSDFAKQLVTRIRKESFRCTDVKRLMCIVPVALGLLHVSDKDLVHNVIFPFVFRLLAHRYPRIRQYTAEQLYVKLIEDDTVVSKSDQTEEAMSILANVVWNRELGPPGNVRKSRNTVADLLGVNLSEKDRVGPAPKVVNKIKGTDEFASYQSLVESAGR